MKWHYGSISLSSCGGRWSACPGSASAMMELSFCCPCLTVVNGKVCPAAILSLLSFFCHWHPWISLGIQEKSGRSHRDFWAPLLNPVSVLRCFSLLLPCKFSLHQGLCQETSPHNFVVKGEDITKNSAQWDFSSFCLSSILQCPHIPLRKLEAASPFSETHIFHFCRKNNLKSHGSLRQNCSHENSLLHNCCYLIMVGEGFFFHLYPRLGQVPCPDAKSQESKIIDLGNKCLWVRSWDQENPEGCILSVWRI